jgi:multidrug resistance efflux pump
MTTAILGGIAMIGTTLMGMAYYHPASISARTYFVTTGIVPNVRGKVIEVSAKPNEKIKKGDILFKLEDTPYRAKVDDITAQLEFAKARLEDTIELRKVAGGSKFDVHEYRKQVGSLTAQLVGANFDLDSCIVRAPSNGYVTHIRVRPGQMAVTIPALPVMTFVNTDSATFIAGFGQEPLSNLKPGNYAEVIFPALPGKSFQAHVVRVLPAMAEGELIAGRNMYAIRRGLPAGQIPVIIKIDEDMTEYNLPLGADAVAVSYTDHVVWGHVAIVRKVLFRMQSWQNFLHFH